MLTEETLRSASLEVQRFLVSAVPEEEAAHKFSEGFEQKMKKTIRKERMRRWLPSLIFLTVALVVFVCSQFADPNTLWMEPLSDADKQYLNQKLVLQYNDKANWNPQQERCEPYYGTINNCIVFKTEPEAYITIEKGRVDAGKYIFYWIHPFQLYAYRDGELCLLSEAYEKGWLTDAHMEKLYERHEEYIALLPEETQQALKESFNISPLGASNSFVPGGFSQELLKEMEQLVRQKYDKEWGNCYYNGTINGVKVVFLTYGGAKDIAQCTMEIAGYTFQWNGIFWLFAYHDGEIYKLQEAYEEGLLNEDHIEQIYEKHKKTMQKLLTPLR